MKKNSWSIFKLYISFSLQLSLIIFTLKMTELKIHIALLLKRVDINRRQEAEDGEFGPQQVWVSEGVGRDKVCCFLVVIKVWRDALVYEWKMKPNTMFRTMSIRFHANEFPMFVHQSNKPSMLTFVCLNKLLFV